MPLISDHVVLLNQALSLRAQRHAVLASNVANADTPNYKARDFDFQAALQNARNGRSDAGGITLATTSARHLSGGGMNSAVNLQYRGENQSAVDGNTVDMDVERAQLADNAMQYQILTQFISDKFKGMRTALSGTQG